MWGQMYSAMCLYILTLLISPVVSSEQDHCCGYYSITAIPEICVSFIEFISAAKHKAGMRAVVIATGSGLCLSRGYGN